MILKTENYIKERIESLKNEVKELKNVPKLVIIKANNDLASEKYIKNKVKRCEEIGIKSQVIEFDENVTQKEVRDKIEELNSDKDVTAILLQLPLFSHLDEFYLVNQICPYKEVDGFCIYNSGLLALGKENNAPCTPLGIINFLLYNEIDLKGKDITIVNASNIIGKPLVHLFLKHGATPTICHKDSKNVKDKIKQADIVVLATGNADFVGVEDLREGQIVIDVSINFKNGKICGDIKKEDYQALNEKGVLYTSVPNGVGQLTTLTLIEQTVEIAKKLDIKRD